MGAAHPAANRASVQSRQTIPVRIFGVCAPGRKVQAIAIIWLLWEMSGVLGVLWSWKGERGAGNRGWMPVVCSQDAPERQLGEGRLLLNDFRLFAKASLECLKKAALCVEGGTKVRFQPVWLLRKWRSSIDTSRLRAGEFGPIAAPPMLLLLVGRQLSSLTRLLISTGVKTCTTHLPGLQITVSVCGLAH
jgi:hypothetical protein